MRTVAGHKYFFSAEDIAADLSISVDEAAGLVKANGFDVSVGAKMFVDRVRFDEWCMEQNCQESSGNGSMGYGAVHIRAKSQETGK